MNLNNGKFVISLDFELMWGVHDKRTIDSYGSNIAKVHEIIPRMLTMFKEYGIQATFSTVGLLFGHSKSDVFEFLPKQRPNYSNKKLCPYSLFETIQEEHNQYYFAGDLIRQIQEAQVHEIGTHSFSHFYCNEAGQTIEHFDCDLKAAQLISEKFGLSMESIVFPRNQVRNDYLNVCKQNGIKVYRGTDGTPYYNSNGNVIIRYRNKIIRFLDTYIKLTNHNCSLPEKKDDLINVKASRILKGYNKKLSLLEPLKISRIKKSMTYAAKNNLIYHLWWHPHNFGSFTDENFQNLNEILAHYSELQKTYNMNSATMKSFSEFTLKSFPELV